MENHLMAVKTVHKIEEKKPEQVIVFKCKYCGETKPFSEMTMMRWYYPQLAACKSCANGNFNPPAAL